MAGTSTRLRALLGAAAVLAGLVAVPGASAAPAERLEVSGAGAASMDLVLRKSSEILPDGFQMKTKGTYAGVAIQDSTGRVLAVAMNVQTWINSRPSVANQPVSNIFGFEKIILKPGRYRLLLLADGPSTVSIPVTGDLARAVRPTKPYADNVAISDVTGPVDGVPVNQGVVSADFRKSRFAIVAHHRETKAMQGQVTDFCLAPVGARTCTPTQDIGGTHVLQNAGAQPGDGWTRSELYTHTFLPGVYDGRNAYDARFTDASVDLPSQRYALVVVI